METATTETPTAPSDSDAKPRVVFEELEPYPDKHRLRGLFRARVPGGWLVTGGPARGGMTYVPDPDHAWLAPGGEPFLFSPDHSPPGGSLLPKE
jgi:hypothetical protein